MSGDGRGDGRAVCPGCGTSPPDGARWCGRCGDRLGNGPDREDVGLGDGPDRDAGTGVPVAPVGAMSGSERTDGAGRSWRRLGRWALVCLVLGAVSIVVVAGVPDTGPRTLASSTSLGATDGSGVTGTRRPASLEDVQRLRPPDRRMPVGYVRSALEVGGTAVVDVAGGVAGLRDGRLVWQLPVAGITPRVGAAIDHARLVVAAGRELLELDPVDGAVVHRSVLRDEPTSYPHITHVVGDLALLTDAPGLRVVEIGSGRTRWQADGGHRTLIGVTEEHAVLSSRGRFEAVELATGETVAEWGEGAVGYRAAVPYRRTVVAGGLVIQERESGGIEAVDPVAGRLVWGLEVDGTVSSLVGPTPDGGVIVSTRGEDGSVALLVGPDGAEVRRWHLDGAMTPVAVTGRGLVASSRSRIALHPFDGPDGPSWTFDRDDPDERQRAVGATGVVLVPGPTAIEVLDDRDGRRIGRLPAAFAHHRAPGVAADGLVVTPGPRTEAWDVRGGAVRWGVRGADDVVGMPGRLLLVERAHGPDEPGAIRSVDPEDGSTRWEFDVDAVGPSLAVPFAGEVLLAHPTIAEGGAERSRLSVRDTDTGRVLGQLQLDASAHPWLIRGDEDGAVIVAQEPPRGPQRLLFVSPDVHDEGVVALTTEWVAELPEALGDIALTRDAVVVRGVASIVCLDRQDGAVRWRIPTDRPTRTGLVVQDGHVVVGVGVDAIRAHRISDGEESWRYEHGVPFVTPAVGAGGAVHAIDQEHRVVAVSAGGARIVGTLPEGAAPVGSPLVTSDALVIETTDGTVMLGAG